VLDRIAVIIDNAPSAIIMFNTTTTDGSTEYDRVVVEIYDASNAIININTTSNMHKNIVVNIL
jgi:hypothetical protein